MESNKAEDSNSLTAVDDITRWLHCLPPPPLRLSENLHSHDPWRLFLANSMKFESSFQDIAKHEDYLAPTVLAAVSAKIGGRVTKKEEDDVVNNSTSMKKMIMKKNRDVDLDLDLDFEWPDLDELRSPAKKKKKNNAAAAAVNFEQVALKRLKVVVIAEGKTVTESG